MSLDHSFPRERFPLHFLERALQAKMEVAAAYGCEPKDLHVAGFGLEMRLDGRVVAVRAAHSTRWVVVGVHA